MSSVGPWTAEELATHLAQAARRAYARRYADELEARARVTLPGALRRASPALLVQAHELLLREEVSSAGIADVTRMWMAPVHGMGEAWFPVVLGDKGYVYTLRIGRRDEDIVPPACDAAFSEAVDCARRWSASVLGGVDTRELSWTVYPELRTSKGEPTGFTGGSVFSAAVVAWYGYLDRRRPRENAVWTGCPAQEIGELRVRSVAPATLPLKRVAAAHLGVETLYVPEGQDEPREPWPLRAMRTVRRPAEIIASAFGVEPTRVQRRASPEAGLDVARLPPSSCRALYVLDAAKDALTGQVLADAVYHEAWPEPLGGEARVLDVALAPLGALVVREGGRFVLTRDDVGDFGADPRFRRTAHLALADACDDDEARTLHRCIADGSTDVLVAALQTPAHARRLLARLEAAEGAQRVQAMLDRVPHESPAGYARLAWEASALSAPCNLVAARIYRSENDVDVLLSVQALAESLLHILAAAAISLGTTKLIDKLADRPNIGDLATAARSLFVETTGEVHPVHAALRSALEPIHADLSAFAEVFNDALHGRAALANLSTRGATPHLPRAVALTARLVRALRPFLTPGALGPVAEGTSWTLRTPDGEVAFRGEVRTGADGGPLFRRGLLEGKERYWAFHGAFDLWPQGRPFAPDPVQSAQPHGSELPLPLARLLAAVRRRTNDPLALLALADLLLAVRLRLAWFTTLASDRERGAEARRVLAGDAKQPLELARKNHRNLWKAVKDSPELCAPRASFLVLLDRLERLAHAPGPLTDHAALLEELRPHLVALCDREVWLARPVFGFDGTQWWSLSGQTPRPCAPPEGCARAAAGTVVLVHTGQLLELSPFALFRDGEVFLYQEEAGKRATYASVGEPGHRAALPALMFRDAAALGARTWKPLLDATT